MRYLKKFLKWIAFTSGAFIVGVLALVVLGWFFPSLWLTESTVRFASRFAPEVGLEIYWNGPLKVKAETISIFGKRLTLQASNVCVHIPQGGTDACVDNADIDVSFLLRFGFSITRIDNLVLNGGRVVIRDAVATAPKTEEPKSEEGLIPELPLGLESAFWGKVYLGLKSFRYLGKTETIAANAVLEILQKEKGLEWNLNGKGSYTPSKGKAENADIHLQMLLASPELTSFQKATLTGSYQGSFYLPLAVQAGLENNQLNLQVGVNYKVPLITAAVKISPPENKALVFRDLKADGDFVVEKFEDVVKTLEKTWMAIPSPLNDLRGKIQLHAEYRTESAGKRIVMPLKLTTQLGSPSQRFVLGSEGEMKFSSLHEEPATDLTAAVDIEQVRLVLPPLNIESIPPIFPDSRIRPTERSLASNQNEERGFEYKIQVNSRPQAIHIVTNLAKSPLPVELKLLLDSSQPFQGQINFGTTKLDVLRRDATLQKAVLKFPSSTAPPEVSAEVAVKYSEYTVFAHIFGTMEKPDFFLTSEPPLSEQDAMSVLLFGQTTTELDAAQADSLADTRAAIANRAVNLASMYLLATTPIESVGYDPASNTVSARVRLVDGTTLQVKSSGRDLSGLGLRQRLGGPWSIRTEIENIERGQSERSASAVLEWSNRY